MQAESRTSRRRRVLLVVSAFNPAIIADMQRARMLAWELPRLGWDVEVLTPRASEVRQDVVERDAGAFFAPDVRTHEVGSMARPLLEALGSRSHGWRTLLSMHRRGSALIASKRFDLIYFSTTTFVYFALGAAWKRRYGVPYLIDFHDPWVTTEGVADSPQGWRSQGWRSRLTQYVANRMERAAVTKAEGLVAVSPDYVALLRRRYQAFNPAWLATGRHAVIPFGALDRDLVEAARAKRTVVARSSTELNVHYVGAGGAIMVRSFTLICRALALLRSQGNQWVARVRVRLFGTVYDWKPGDAKQLEGVAKSAGLADLVTECPQRVSYRRSLEILMESDGALILGVDDSGYMPSKLFSYALSGKPLLAALRRDSHAYAQVQHAPGLGHALWFDPHEEMPVSEAAALVQRFVDDVAARKTFDRRAMLTPFLAPAMAMRHADLFAACLPPNQ
jgi:hypothetical protein